ncbi:thiopurine S-methyltransferase [Endozoicomonas sp. Mp262]|uniref:thiopurine S-methyltransferase n=1 Tax=Endozoicomonas sp. Mp262 TaxID=2919499 RepID=UPI0021D913D1
MNTDFWLEKWKKNEIGFHKNETNPLLMKYFDRLSLTKGSCIFLPLCGKTLDIAWLLSMGYQVVGAELSKHAVDQLFDEAGIIPEIRPLKDITIYKGSNITIFLGNIFTLSQSLLGTVDAIYDRAALVALPESSRSQYTQHLIKISHGAPQLLITLEYDQRLLSGPPFSVSSDEITHHYHHRYHLTPLESNTVPNGLKGQYDVQETIWLLSYK